MDVLEVLETGTDLQRHLFKALNRDKQRDEMRKLGSLLGTEKISTRLLSEEEREGSRVAQLGRPT